MLLESLRLSVRTAILKCRVHTVAEPLTKHFRGSYYRPERLPINQRALCRLRGAVFCLRAFRQSESPNICQRLRLRLYIKAIHDKLAAITAFRHKKIKHGVWAGYHKETQPHEHRHTFHYKVR